MRLIKDPETHKPRPGATVLAELPRDTLTLIEQNGRAYTQTQGHTLLLIYNEAGRMRYYQRNKIEQHLGPVLTQTDEITPIRINHPPQLPPNAGSACTILAHSKRFRKIRNLKPPYPTNSSTKWPPIKQIQLEERTETADELILDTAHIYTDGSKIATTPLAGSAVYEVRTRHQNAKAKIFQFDGAQNSYRAELVALREATKEGAEHTSATDIHVYTDCLSGLYGILKWKRLPNRMRTHPHKNLIKEICDIATNAPDKTFYYHKVAAHTGIEGNEIADECAKSATISDGEDEKNRTFTLLEETGADIPTLQCLSDTNKEDHNTLKLNHYHDGGYTRVKDIEAWCETSHYQIAFKESNTVQLLFQDTCRREDVTSAQRAWPNILRGAKIWTANTEAERTTFFKHLYYRFATINDQWHYKFDKNNKHQMCPVCQKHEASQAHVRSNCSNSEMSAMYTYRHNQGVENVHTAIRKGDKGSFHLKADANKHSDIPQPRATIPRKAVNTHGLTPQEEETMRKIPDIALIENVTLTKDIRHDGKYPIHTFDIGYCESKNIYTTSEKKTQHYRPLINLLSKQGHNAKFTPIIMGTIVPLKDDDLAHIYNDMGLTKAGHDKLHNKLWKDSLTHLHKISVKYKMKEAHALTYIPT
jgi:ribonuclease HI